MTSLRLFRSGKADDDLKGIRARSAVVRSAELALPAFPRAITREEARAALRRSRARRASNGD